WIRYPRDALRFSNAVKFAWSALKDEIDPQDLVCMEGLRLFDQPLFDWIRRNRDFLLQEGRWQMATKEEAEAFCEALRSGLASETREDQVEVLCTLFPTRASVIRDGHGLGEPYHKTGARHGVAYKAGYDAYFSLFPSPNH